MLKNLLKVLSEETSLRKVLHFEQVGAHWTFGRFDSDHAKNNMASLLENQAKELLREASMKAGDVEGFAAVAFPIVRRVFAHLSLTILLAFSL